MLSLFVKFVGLSSSLPEGKFGVHILSFLFGITSGTPDE